MSNNQIFIGSAHIWTHVHVCVSLESEIKLGAIDLWSTVVLGYDDAEITTIA